MEYLANGYTLEICEGGFPLSTDSMVLSGFVRLPRRARVLDLGAGCGTLGLLLCAKNADCTVTGLELSPEAHAMALENIRRNGLEARMDSICADLRHSPKFLPQGQFDACVSNPPYFSSGPASKTLAGARREDTCSPEELFAAAARSLKFGGDFFLVHRPERLGELCALGERFHLIPKRLTLVRHRRQDNVSLILLALRKGARHGLLWEELCLFENDGNPTEDYRELYHL